MAKLKMSELTEASRKGRRNKAKGGQFERVVVNAYKGAFPGYKFKRVPDGLKFEGDIMIPEHFPYRCIECRGRAEGSAYDFRRFFIGFKKSNFGKWVDECNEKFSRSWIIPFKVGRGGKESVFVMCEDKLNIKRYIYNGVVYVYTLDDFLDWLVIEVKEIEGRGKSRDIVRRNKKVGSE
jgi:hypothetical protein